MPNISSPHKHAVLFLCPPSWSFMSSASLAYRNSNNTRWPEGPQIAQFLHIQNYTRTPRSKYFPEHSVLHRFISRVCSCIKRTAFHTAAFRLQFYVSEQLVFQKIRSRVYSYCNEGEIGTILFDVWVTDVPCHVSYRTLEMRWLSAQQFDTLQRMLEKTFLHTLISQYNTALEGNCPHSHDLSLQYTWSQARSSFRRRRRRTK